MSPNPCKPFSRAGVPRGRVLSATDALAGDVSDRPVDPRDILCTAYHLLGVDPRLELVNPLGRPLPLVGGGAVVRELLG